MQIHNKDLKKHNYFSTQDVVFPKFTYNWACQIPEGRFDIYESSGCLATKKIVTSQVV